MGEVSPKGDATAAPPPVSIGDVLAGKYRVEGVLGAGGMGVVVAATHVHLDQRVALKFLLPESLESEQVVARFKREARAAVRLRSEHVARVIDVGELTSGAPYMVMELLEGRDLGDLITEDGPQPVEKAVDYVLQACEAVAEAHALGIIHRDLKPSNLFLTSRVDHRPLVKVLDFGISKVSNPGEELSLTSTAEVVGTPHYMSPEQLRAAKLADARSDIWALGAILYELLSGHVPFAAETLTQLCALVLQDPPRPLQELRGDVPPELVAIVERCLEKEPSRRFQSVAELAEALDPFAPERSLRPARRVGAVAAGRAPSLPPPPSRRVAPEGEHAAPTSAAWDKTALAPSKPPVSQPTAPPMSSRPTRATVLTAATVGIAAAVGLGALALRQRPAEMKSAAAAPAPTPGSVTATPSVASPAAPSAVVPPLPSAAAATAATISTTSRSPSSRGAPPSRPAPRPTAPTPRAAAPGDDLPDQRH